MPTQSKTKKTSGAKTEVKSTKIDFGKKILFCRIGGGAPLLRRADLPTWRELCQRRTLTRAWIAE